MNLLNMLLIFDSHNLIFPVSFCSTTMKVFCVLVSFTCLKKPRLLSPHLSFLIQELIYFRFQLSNPRVVSIDQSFRFSFNQHLFFFGPSLDLRCQKHSCSTKVGHYHISPPLPKSLYPSPPQTNDSKQPVRFLHSQSLTATSPQTEKVSFEVKYLKEPKQQEEDNDLRNHIVSGEFLIQEILGTNHLQRNPYQVFPRWRCHFRSVYTM